MFQFVHAFEESLAHLDDEAMLDTVDDWMDIFSVKDEFDEDFSAADFFIAAETAIAPAQTIMRELPQRFRKWICTLKPTIAEKPLEGIINNQFTFINFNYTEFLETIYGVPKKKVWYIHGDRRNKKKELILGHAPGAGSEVDTNPCGRRIQRSKMKSQTSYDLYETAGYYLNDYYNFTTKKCSNVIKANKDRFMALSNVKTLVVIGHSLSTVDYPYFKEIINNNQNVSKMKWYFSLHSVDGLRKTTKFVSEMHISNSNVELFRT